VVKKGLIILSMIVFVILVILIHYHALHNMPHDVGDIASPLVTHELFSNGFTALITNMQSDTITLTIERNHGHEHLYALVGFHANVEYFDGTNWRELPIIRSGFISDLGFILGSGDGTLSIPVDLSLYPRLRRGGLYRIRKRASYASDHSRMLFSEIPRHDFVVEFYWRNP